MTDSRIEMIKFVLAFIALILVMLGIYTYSNQDAKKTVPTSPSVTKVTQKVEVEETEKVLPQTHEVKAKTSSVKNTTVKSPKVVSHKTSNEMEDTEEIGKGLTLESIENADVSDEEKERMRDDMAYYQGLHAEPSEPLTDETIVKMIDEDLKNGFVQSN